MGDEKPDDLPSYSSRGRVARAGGRRGKTHESVALKIRGRGHCARVGGVTKKQRQNLRGGRKKKKEQVFVMRKENKTLAVKWKNDQSNKKVEFLLQLLVL